jgi:hypothetical protein
VSSSAWKRPRSQGTPRIRSVGPTRLRVAHDSGREQRRSLAKEPLPNSLRRRARQGQTNCSGNVAGAADQRDHEWLTAAVDSSGAASRTSRWRAHRVVARGKTGRTATGDSPEQRTSATTSDPRQRSRAAAQPREQSRWRAHCVVARGKTGRTAAGDSPEQRTSATTSDPRQRSKAAAQPRERAPGEPTASSNEARPSELRREARRSGGPARPRVAHGSGREQRRSLVCRAHGEPTALSAQAGSVRPERPA